MLLSKDQLLLNTTETITPKYLSLDTFFHIKMHNLSASLESLQIISPFPCQDRTTFARYFPSNHFQFGDITKEKAELKGFTKFTNTYRNFEWTIPESEEQRTPVNMWKK